MAGPDLMPEILRLSEAEGYTHYFYGSTERTLKYLEKNIREKYPKLKIAGIYSPPFRRLTKEEDQKVIERINAAKPDFIWVGLGAPKQEKWMAAHQGKIEGFMVGVGAAFDYLVGNIKRAPKWMQDKNMEWAYRLMQEPKRLFSRYWHSNTKFIWYACIRGK